MRASGILRFTALLLALLVAGAVGLVTAAYAGKHVAIPGSGAKVVLKDQGDELRKLKAKLPARCESSDGQRSKTKLAVKLEGRLPLDGGRFTLAGDAPNGVEIKINGKRLGDGGFKGRVRLTYLDLDFVGPSDDSVLCDSGTVRYRTR